MTDEQLKALTMMATGIPKDFDKVRAVVEVLQRGQSVLSLPSHVGCNVAPDANLTRLMRILKDDDKFVVAEIAKSLDTEIQLAPLPGEVRDTRFFSFLYVKNDGHGNKVPWDPWDKD